MWTLFCHQEITATFKEWMEINHQMFFCFSPVNIFSQTRVGPLCLLLSLRHWTHSCNKWLSHVQQCSFNDNLLMESLDWQKWPLHNSLPLSAALLRLFFLHHTPFIFLNASKKVRIGWSSFIPTPLMEKKGKLSNYIPWWLMSTTIGSFLFSVIRHWKVEKVEKERK